MEGTSVADVNGMEVPSATTAAMASSGSWVVEMEKMIGDIGSPSVDTLQQRERPSIYQIPEYIKDMTNRKAYQPRVVSLGPFHHGDPMLRPMETHKHRAVAHLIKRSSKPPSEFFDCVKEIAEQLQSAYENLDEKWHGEKFVELMVTDGCFLLEVIRMYRQEWRVCEDYGHDDPVFSEHGYLNLSDYIFDDIIMIENQLPLLLLQKLMFVADTSQDEGEIDNNWVLDSIPFYAVTTKTPVDGHLGLHILDVLHKSFCGTRRHCEGRLNDDYVMGSASELHEAGIRFKVSDAHGFAGAVRFEEGVLSIPRIFMDDNADLKFLNLMAFEKLHPGAGDNVTAFVCFMDHLVDTAKDVALLKSKGILDNSLGSDEAVANLINNTLTKGTFIGPDNSLRNVLWEVDAYCKKPWNRWRASFIHTYFSNPWVFISLVAAIVLLLATIIQTIYAVVSFHRKS